MSLRERSSSASLATADSIDGTFSAPPTTHRSQLTLLRCRVAALETMLLVERRRRQAVIDRYEKLLDER